MVNGLDCGFADACGLSGRAWPALDKECWAIKVIINNDVRIIDAFLLIFLVHPANEQLIIYHESGGQPVYFES